MFLKSDKHLILIFMVLLMLMVIPTSFAADASDDGSIIASADDVVLATSADDVNAAVSANLDNGDVVIGDGEDLIISTNPGNVSNYTIGSSQEITVNIEQSSNYNNWKNSIGTLYAYMDINDGEHKVSTFGGWYLSVNTFSTFTFDLNEIDSSYFKEGENTLKIAVDTEKLDQHSLTYDFIPLTVNAAKATSKLNTSISVSPEEMELKVGDSNYFTAILDPSSAGYLSYKSSDESVATVSSWGKVTAVGVGTANITISFPGNDLYNAAEINMTVTVPAPAYTSTPTSNGKDDVDYLIGDDLKIDVEIDYITEEEDYWKGYDLSGDNMYVYINGEAVKLDNISSDAKNFTVNIADINYTFEPSKKYSLIFRPSNSIVNMANLDLSDCLLNTLTVNARKYSEDLVISTEPSTVSNYSLGSSQIITVYVEKSEDFRNLITGTTYAFIDMNNGSYVINYFDGWRRSVTTYNTWTFDLSEIDVSYFKVGENILNITVATSALDSKNLTYNFIPLVVDALELTSKINTTITSNYDEMDMEVGDSNYFTATLTPSAAGDLTYSSSDESVATVSSWGKISAVGPGVANITISYPGNDYYNPAEHNITVTVAVPAPEYTSTPTVNGKNDTEYVIGEDISVDVEIDYVSDKEDYWSGYDLSGDNMYVYVNGTAVKLDNIASEVKNFTVSLSDINYTFETGKTYSLVFHPSNSVLNMAYLSSSDCLFNTLTINVVDGVKDLVISTEPSTVENYTPSTSQLITVNVEKSDKFKELITGTLYAFINMNNGSHRISTFNGWYRSVSTFDTWTFDLSEIDVSYFNVGENILNIVVATSSLDSENLTYEFIPLVVNALELTSKINTSISVNYEEMELEIGDSQYFVATLTPSSAGSLSYNSSDESVATVSSFGKITAVGPGVANITISYPGNDYYNAAEDKIITVTVPEPTPDYISTPTVNGKNVTDYAIGENLNIDVEIDYLTEEDDYWKGYDLSGDNMYVYINGTAVKLDNIASEVKNFTVSLSDINFTFETGKSYSLIFRPSNSIINMAYLDFDDCVFNTLTVTVVDQQKYDGIIYVDLEGDDSNIGSEDKPVATIAKAIELATSDDNTAHKIVIRKGTYKESDLAVDSDLEIVGEDATIDAENNGRILNITDGNVKISSLTFANANVNGYGGAIEIQKATVEIDNSTFVNNTATSGAGAILWNADNGKLTNSVFENNSGRNGAAVAIGELGWSPKGDNTEISNCVFNNNNNLYNAAGCIGLAIYADDVKVTDSNFTNNHGMENSNHGALYILGDNAEVSGCLFENNSMDGAGAMQADGDYVNIHDNVFNNNTITGGIASRAGAIEIQSINAEITNNIFTNNGGYGCREGGAINIVYVDYDGEITISGNEFINNSAAYGGAIFVDGGFEDLYNEFAITIEENTFDSNVAGYGAGIYTIDTGDSVVTISNNEFKNQTANEGGAIYSYDSQIALDSNTMENCIALENGADIYLEYGEITTEVTLIISEDSTIKLGDSIIVNASLTDDNGNTVSGGIIIFTVDDDTLYEVDVVNGTASVELTPDAIGNYTISGSYSFASDVDVTEAIIEVISNKEDAGMNITADSITEGENATVSVVLPEDASGNVTVGNVTVPVVNGTASVSVPGLPVGNNTLPVVYSGDDKYNPAESNATVSVIPKEEPVPSKENATMDVSADSITEGENATVSVVLPEDASGNVTVGNVTVPVVNGTASVSVPGLPVGNNTLPVVYSGDDKYNPAESNATVSVIPKEEPVPSKENATMDVSADSITEGENATVSVTLPEDASGNVTVGNVTVPVVNGTASVSVPGLPVGNNTLPVVYSGDDKYNPLTKEINVTVDEDISEVISAPDVTKYYKGSERFVVTVTDSKGNPLVNKSVSITINGVDYEKTTDVNGTASIALGLPSGEYNVTTIVDNTTVSSVVTVLTTVNGTDVVKVFRNGTQYYATFRDSEGNYLPDGTTVRFNINGVMYDRKVNGTEGLARLNINLEAGEYILTAMNLNTGEMSSNNITVISRLVENRDITKYYRNGTQYTVKVIGDDGNPVGAGENVTFNIHGVFYTRQTDENGIAKLNINLEPGDYIITAEYKECRVSNDIHVLPVLSAEDLTKTYGTSDQFVATLLDGQGNPYANQNITFNINGVFYNRITDGEGHAKLNINLMPGEYIITSSYNGCNIANTVKVNA